MAAIGHALRDQSKDVGPPRMACIDNGKDFDAYVFHGQTKKERRQRAVSAGHCDETFFAGIYRLLGVEVSFSLPYNPNGKPRQERFYGRLHEKFCKSWFSYTGSSTETRPERLLEILNTPGRVPNFADVQSSLGEFITGFNKNAEHQVQDLVDEDRERLSPDGAMSRWLATRRAFADPTVLDALLQKWHQPVTVGRNGISLSIQGVRVRYGQYEPALRQYKGSKRKVHVCYDPHDVRAVQVRDEQGRFICMAEANKLGGLKGAIGEDRIKEHMKDKREYDRAQKIVVKQKGMRRVESGEERIARDASKSAPAPNPERLQPIQTPLDGQSEQVAASSYKLAAGAEHADGQQHAGGQQPARARRTRALAGRVAPATRGTSSSSKRSPGRSLQDLMGEKGGTRNG